MKVVTPVIFISLNTGQDIDINKAYRLKYKNPKLILDVVYKLDYIDIISWINLSKEDAKKNTR